MVDMPVATGDITAATEGITAATEDITVAIEGIMVATEGIMVGAIITEVPASTSADTLGSPTTIRTVIIPTVITILTPTLLPITRMLLPSLPSIPNRSQTPIGTIARIRQGITLTLQAVRGDGRG